VGVAVFVGVGVAVSTGVAVGRGVLVGGGGRITRAAIVGVGFAAIATGAGVLVSAPVSVTVSVTVGNGVGCNQASVMLKAATEATAPTPTITIMPPIKAAINGACWRKVEGALVPTTKLPLLFVTPLR
jgi:hypothetical protein